MFENNNDKFRKNKYDDDDDDDMETLGWMKELGLFTNRPRSLSVGWPFFFCSLSTSGDPCQVLGYPRPIGDNHLAIVIPSHSHPHSSHRPSYVSKVLPRTRGAHVWQNAWQKTLFNLSLLASWQLAASSRQLESGGWRRPQSAVITGISFRKNAFSFVSIGICIMIGLVSRVG